MRGRTIVAAAVGIGVLALGLGYQQWYAPTRYAVDIGSGMLAKQMCSCVLLAGRSAGDCRADQFASMDAIEVDIDRVAQRVRAGVTGFGERTAIYRDGFGCTLE